jgi:hypothetical protein
MKALADNDILSKGACFRILDSLVGESRSDVGVLGAAKFVLPKKMKKASLRGAPADAIAVLEEFLRDAESIEPTDDEQELAAALELSAQREGLPFDSGESQLCAVLIVRAVPRLVTGDKRAIQALERLLDLESRLATAQGRIQSLEQAVRLAIDRIGVDSVRGAVCAEPDVDRALTMCFSCGNPSLSPDSVFEGLSSYIADLRGKASRILAAEP